MKIGQISHLYRPRLGGIENYVYRLKGSLEKEGHEVTVYTADLSICGPTPRKDNTFYFKTDLLGVERCLAVGGGGERLILS